MPQNFQAYTKPEQDGRRKLSVEDYDDIRVWIANGNSQRATAKHFNCSRRMVVWISQPEKYEAFRTARMASKKHLEYYDKEKHRLSVQKYRAKKRLLSIPNKPKPCLDTVY